MDNSKTDDDFLQKMLGLFIQKYGVVNLLTQLHYALMEQVTCDYNAVAQDIWQAKNRHRLQEQYKN